MSPVLIDDRGQCVRIEAQVLIDGDGSDLVVAKPGEPGSLGYRMVGVGADVEDSPPQIVPEPRSSGRHDPGEVGDRASGQHQSGGPVPELEERGHPVDHPVLDGRHPRCRPHHPGISVEPGGEEFGESRRVEPGIGNVRQVATRGMEDPGAPCDVEIVEELA